MATTFGTRPEDTVADSRGNVLSGVVLTLYATKADATAQTAPVATVTTNARGLWSFADGSSRSGLFARDASGNVWAVNAEEVGASIDAKADAAATTTALGTKTNKKALPALTALKTALSDATKSCAIQILGDSTGDGTTDWPYRLAQLLAPLYPAWNVVHRVWDDTSQDFLAPTTIQTGTSGERYLNLTAGSFPRKLANNAAPHLTGIIDVRVDMYAADWTPANSFGSTLLVLEGGGTNDWGWYFSINTAGFLQFVGSTDGVNLNAIMASTASAGITDGTRSWIRAVFNPNDGAGNRTASFYKSADGITWTQVGTTVTTAGAVVLSDRIAAGSNYKLGGSGAATNQTAFQIYQVDIRNGSNGYSVVPRMPDLWGPYGAGQATQPIVGAPTLTFVNGSKSGAGISYLDDPTRRPKLTPDYGQVVTFLSSSHNEVGLTGPGWSTLYSTWVTDVRGRVGGGIVACTQNPEQSGTDFYVEHARRRQGLVAFGPLLGVGVIDTYQAFLDAGWPGSLMADNIHPNATGSDLWRDTVKAAIDAS